MAKTYSSKSNLSNIGPLQANQSGSPDDRGNGLPAAANAFLNTLAGPESGGDYNIIYRGDHFKTYDAHPQVWVKIPNGPNKGKYSSAAGKYQFIESTWEKAAKLAGVKDFSPASQDKAAWALAQKTYRDQTGRNLLADLQSGDPKIMAKIPGALSGEWDSLPGGGQPGTTTRKFIETYNSNLTKVTGHPVPPLGMPSDPPVPQPRHMASVARGLNAPADAPVPQPRYMGSVARALDTPSRPPSYDYLPPVPGLPASPPRPTSDASAPGLGGGSANANLRSAQAEQAAQRQAAQAPSRPSQPASQNPGVIRTGQGIAGTVQLPPGVRPQVPPIVPPPSKGTSANANLNAARAEQAAAAGRSAAPSVAEVPKYVTTTVPVTTEKANPAWEKWNSQYGVSANQNLKDAKEEQKIQRAVTQAAIPPEPPKVITVTTTKTVTRLNPEFETSKAPGLPGQVPGAVAAPRAQPGGFGILGVINGGLNSTNRRIAFDTAVAQQARRDPAGYAIGQANRASPNPSYDVSGGNNAFNPASVQNSSRWQTGY